MAGARSDKEHVAPGRVESASVADARARLVTISVPVYNEEDNIERLLSELREFAASEPSYRFEFLFTDNASEDRTFEMLVDASRDDPRIRVLRFSRNFGFQKSILTNFLNARGDAAVQIDADLQDPPSVISEFLRLWEEGFKVVYGVRRRRQENALLNLSRRAYYALITALSPAPVPRDAGDFRLIDRRIIDHLADVDEQTPYLRGIIASLGYPQTGVVYDRHAREAGTSKFGLMKLVELGIDGLTAQSTRPLRFITVFGLFMSIVSVVLIVFYLLVGVLYAGNTPSGFTTIVLLLLFLVGLNSFILGVLGEYVGRIFNNTRGLPMTIIEQRVEAAAPPAQPAKAAKKSPIKATQGKSRS